MLNIEKYKDEIRGITLGNLALVDGEPTHCMGLDCDDCDLNYKEHNCAEKMLDWLTAEYQPKEGEN